MRAVLIITVIFALGMPPARADAGLEARVLRLEAQVRALQESLKAAVQMDRVYNLKAANGPSDACLSSGTTAPSAVKGEVFLGNCRDADDHSNGQRNWKIEPSK